MILQKKSLSSILTNKILVRILILLQALFSGPVFSEPVDCNKPYSYFSNSNSVNLIEKCENFKRFYQKYVKFEIGVIYISEFPQSASSAFGHVAMILIDNEDLLNSPTISFLAQTNNEDNILSYSFKGLLGGYNGAFKEVPLFRLINSYVYGENRNLYIYKFKKNFISKELLLSFLYENEQKSNPYFFLSYNCSSGPSLLIEKATKRKLTNQSLIYYPQDLLNRYKDNLDLYKEFLDPNLRLFVTRKKVSEEFISKTRKAINVGNKILPPSDNHEEQFLSNLYDFISSKGNRYDNAKKTIKEFPESISIPIDYHIAPENYDKKTRLELGLLKSKNDIFTKISYRPTYRNKFEQKVFYNNLYTMEILKLDFLVRKFNQFYLDKIHILNLETLNHFEWPSKLLSSKFVVDFDNNQIAQKDAEDKRARFSYQLGLSSFSNFITSTLVTGPQFNFLVKAKKPKFFDYTSLNFLLKKRDYLISVENNFSILSDRLDRNTNLDLIFNFPSFDLKCTVAHNWSSSDMSFLTISLLKNF